MDRARRPSSTGLPVAAPRRGAGTSRRRGFRTARRPRARSPPRPTLWPRSRVVAPRTGTPDRAGTDRAPSRPRARAARGLPRPRPHAPRPAARRSRAAGRSVERGRSARAAAGGPCSASQRCSDLLRDRCSRYGARQPGRRSRHSTVCERPLGEGRKRANLLDLVAEQLDPQRLAAGRREDVDDASAHGELPALVDPLDAFVARARERRHEPVDPGLLADHEAHGPSDGFGGRHSLCERRGRRTDESTGGEDVERPCSFADEMRRRLEPRGVRDAPARQQRDPLGPEEPRRPSAASRASASSGSRIRRPRPSSSWSVASTSGRRRLRHPRTSGQGRHEGLEAVARRELRDECVKGCLVHANGGERAPRGLS